MEKMIQKAIGRLIEKLLENIKIIALMFPTFINIRKKLCDIFNYQKT